MKPLKMSMYAKMIKKETRENKFYTGSIRFLILKESTPNLYQP